MIKTILFVLLGLVCFVIVVSISGFMFIKVMFSEKDSIIKVIKPQNEMKGKALVVFQPGGSSFPEDIAQKISEGLSSVGYEVMIDYPNQKTETDLSNFDFLVLGSPTYAGKFADALKDYIHRIKNLNKVKISVFSTGSGDSIEKQSVLKIKSELESINVKVSNFEFFIYPKKEEITQKALDFGKIITK